VETVLADVCADREHLADHGMGDVVAQVDQSDQHLLIGEQLAPSAAADGALPALLGLLLGVASLHQRGQDGGQ